MLIKAEGLNILGVFASFFMRSLFTSAASLFCISVFNMLGINTHAAFKAKKKHPSALFLSILILKLNVWFINC
ncbi:MAG: hypothetical protein ACI9UT_002025 [Flavobacteriales bacterium]|jgi:hypothetical protein